MRVIDRYENQFIFISSGSHKRIRRFLTKLLGDVMDFVTTISEHVADRFSYALIHEQGHAHYRQQD